MVPASGKYPYSVQLLQAPFARDRGIGQAGNVQQGKRDDLAPRGGVTHASINRVWSILGEPNDVGPWLTAWELSQ